jgi:alkylhydroperoxidase family enzyme
VPRILPLEPPYDPDVARHLEGTMPPGIPPIGLFRTFARNLPMATAMGGWGRYELSKALSLSMRDRELLIDRTCARCGCEYEWGVHVAFFAERVGFTAEHVTSLTHGGPDDGCWTDRDRTLISIADQLHDTATVDDALFGRASALLSEAELLDAFLLCGWYHAISFAANAAGVANEDGAPTFDSVGSPRLLP